MSENVKSADDLSALLNSNNNRWGALTAQDIELIIEKTDVSSGKITSLFLGPALEKLNFSALQDFVSIFDMKIEMKRGEWPIYPGRCENGRCVNQNDGSYCYHC